MAIKTPTSAFGVLFAEEKHMKGFSVLTLYCFNSSVIKSLIKRFFEFI